MWKWDIASSWQLFAGTAEWEMGVCLKEEGDRNQNEFSEGEREWSDIVW